jgi:hypothetical protein
MAAPVPEIMDDSLYLRQGTEFGLRNVKKRRKKKKKRVHDDDNVPKVNICNNDKN